MVQDQQGTGSLFARFAAVGVLGFVVDAMALAVALSLGAGFYFGRIVSFLAAATTTWYANRRITFASRDPRLIREWGLFLSANTVGGLVNYCVYAALVFALPLFREHPTLGVAAGSIAGLLFNFTVSRHLVFRHQAR